MCLLTKQVFPETIHFLNPQQLCST
uniref:Uncharacterized protein n=1 Tax=Arundo donax TaxID=35708 RepID=A0A0A9BFD0_ARUDO